MVGPCAQWCVGTTPAVRYAPDRQRATLAEGLGRRCGSMRRGRQGLFGRRNRENRQEAQREVGRRALFEELAKRPPNICPFLGLASSQTEYHDGFTREHRCYAFGEAAELSAEQQERVCLTRGYGNCPRYLRGVLVIPTEELEALRRPLPPVRPAAPPTAPPPRAPASSGGEGRRLPLLIGLVLLLAVAGTTGAILLTRGPAAVATPTPHQQPARPVRSDRQRRGIGQPGDGQPDAVPRNAQAGSHTASRRHLRRLRGDRAGGPESHLRDRRAGQRGPRGDRVVQPLLAHRSIGSRRPTAFCTGAPPRAATSASPTSTATPAPSSSGRSTRGPMASCGTSSCPTTRPDRPT